MRDATDSLQLILGTDKRNPSFCLYTDADEHELHVYYGLELLEVVPNDRDSPAYRLLAARLYNAGLRVTTLTALFGLDRKTLRTWGLALRSGDRDWLADMLDGRWGRRKFTRVLESYVRHRWPVLRAQGVRDYRRRLLEELQRIFAVKVSGETLRPLLRQLRDGRPADPTPNPAAPEAVGVGGAGEPAGRPIPAHDTAVAATAPALASAASEPPILQTLPLALEMVPLAKPQRSHSETPVCASAPVPTSAEVADAPAVGVAMAPVPSSPPPSASPTEPPAAPLGAPTVLAEVTCVSTPAPASVLPPTSKSLPRFEDWSVGQTAWCEHAGLLLFSEALLAVGGVVAPAQPWLRQALGSVLAGALNVEQTKYLNVEDLDLLLGPQVRGLGAQRHHLKALAEGPTADALLRWNGQRVGAATHSDFYFDPHTKHYTGLAAVLKGWCPTIRWADKALHSDFLHTATGQPLYFECTDNYADLRTRLWGVIGRARTALGWPEDKTLTLIIDRAVFGQETFEQVLAEPALHLITWQKGYRPGGWDDTKVSGQCVIERPRNRAADLQTYQFRYVDRTWAADPRWRQLLVQATNPLGRTVEVAILTDDPVRPAPQIVRRMFGRWVQENDFKYLDQHFGLNQITSYGVINYAELKGQLTDRQIQSGAYRALLEQARQGRAQLGRLLWAEREAEQRQTARQARRTELERELERTGDPAAPAPEPAADPAPARRELARLKTALSRHEAKRSARQQQIAKLEEQLTQTLSQAAQTDQHVSRLENLITRGMVRLDTGPKRLLDAIKVTARNEFYRALAPFRKAYDNYRDDHEHFRRLTQSGGVLRWNGRELEVHLLPPVNYGAALREVWEAVFAELNAAGPLWPDGSGRRLVLRLAHRSELQVSLRGR